MHELSSNLLKFGEIEDGLQEVELNVWKLYPDQKMQKKFRDKFTEFLNADCYNRKVIDADLSENGRLKYRTECIVPRRRDSQHIVPLLFLLGNPASHSVHSKMFFSYERDGREHRFWKALKKADILSFTKKAASNVRIHKDGSALFIFLSVLIGSEKIYHFWN